MKIKTLVIITLVFLGVNTQIIFAQSRPEIAAKSGNISKFKSIYDIDFRNFTFPWSEAFGKGEAKKFFTLRNGKSAKSAGYNLSLENVRYNGTLIDDKNVALVVVKIEDGNAEYNILYIYAVTNGKPKLLQIFEFNDVNIIFGTVYVAHDELVIGRYIQKSSDAECCPSILELSFYKWQNDKFTLQGKPQIISNNYLERTKKRAQ